MVLAAASALVLAAASAMVLAPTAVVAESEVPALVWLVAATEALVLLATTGQSQLSSSSAGSARRMRRTVIKNVDGIC